MGSVIRVVKKKERTILQFMEIIFLKYRKKQNWFDWEKERNKKTKHILIDLIGKGKRSK